MTGQYLPCFPLKDPKDTGHDLPQVLSSKFLLCYSFRSATPQRLAHICKCMYSELQVKQIDSLDLFDNERHHLVWTHIVCELFSSSNRSGAWKSCSLAVHLRLEVDRNLSPLFGSHLRTPEQRTRRPLRDGGELIDLHLVAILLPSIVIAILRPGHSPRQRRLARGLGALVEVEGPVIEMRNVRRLRSSLKTCLVLLAFNAILMRWGDMKRQAPAASLTVAMTFHNMPWF